MVFQNGDSSDPGGSGLPHSLQHSGGCSGKGSFAGIFSPEVGEAWVGVGGGISQHSAICRRLPHSSRNPIWVQMTLTAVVWMF